MAEIKHLLRINSPIQDVFTALVQREGVAGWWTRDCDVSSLEGGLNRFRFDEGETVFTMKILSLTEPHLVEWKCIDGPEPWENTEIHFQLDDEGDSTVLHFSHIGWRSKGNIFQICSFDWAIFLNALRQFVETGVVQTGLGNLRLSRSKI